MAVIVGSPDTSKRMASSHPLMTENQDSNQEQNEEESHGSVLEAEIEHWSTAVICGVIGSNLPLDVIGGFVHRIWAGMDIDKVLFARKGVFIIRFHTLHDRTHPFIVKAWNEDLRLDFSSLQSLPISVQFPKLDIKYWGIESLSKIGSMLGIPIKTDKITKERSVLHYARMLIEMPLNGPFPSCVDFISEGDGVVRQFIKSEWKPIKCSHCRMLGHEEQQCRKKQQSRQEWRVKKTSEAAPVNKPQYQQQLEPRDIDGFVSPRRTITKTISSR
ncbi:hypothetical protein Cgig2_026001 [Carnegiea gigantea]|uniref:DUF4283 domain-containing protein n=1 Tax=Carnegiea gigantea TaxID=171969 RepID=A0A9Q1K247_9CARY|nr:hypothetical protein Cgig2_026001 [Carnegiea gigantea]